MNRVFIRGTEVVTKEYIDNIMPEENNYVIYETFNKWDVQDAGIAYFQRVINTMKEGKRAILIAKYSNTSANSEFGADMFASPTIPENVDLNTYSGKIYFKSSKIYKLDTYGTKVSNYASHSCITVTLTEGVVTKVETPVEYKYNYGDVSVPTSYNVITKDNTTEFTPTEDYHPATKKYVDNTVMNIPTPKTHDGEGIIGWYNTAVDGENLTENYGVTPDMVRAIKAGDKISWPSRTMPGATENTICLYNMTYYVYNKDEMDDLETIDIIIGKVPNETYTYVIVGNNVYKNIF